MFRINERFIVVEGWIVDTQAERVVSLYSIRSLLNASDKRAINGIKDLKVFSNIDVSKNVTVAVASQELFNYVSTEIVTFVSFEERIVKKGTEPHRLAKGSVINEFNLLCHPVTVHGRMKAYLYYPQPNEASKIEASILDIPKLPKTKDTTAYTQIIKSQEFKFTSTDYDILFGLLSKNDTNWKYECGQMMQVMKNAASTKATGYFGRSHHKGSDSFIKDLLPDTLKQYGSRISHLLLVLKCCDKLPIFSKYAATARTVAASLHNKFTAKALASAIGSAVGSLSDGKGDVQFWMTWVYLGAFDFQSWDSWDAVCPMVPILNYRYLLDSLTWLFRYGGVNNGDDIAAVVHNWTSRESSGDDFVGNIRKLYFHVALEATISVSTLVQVNYENKSVEVKKRLLSYSLIGIALRELTADFDTYVKEMSKYLWFPDFNQLHYQSIGHRDFDFTEKDEGESLLVHFTPDMARKLGLNMKWRKDDSCDNDQVVAIVKNLMGKIHRSIMVMVWMSTGMPMRFPELATLSYAGTSRNIFFDSMNRRLYIQVKYNKNQRQSCRILFITDAVSKRLWWTLAILRPFIYGSFHSEVGLYDKTVFMKELNLQIARDLAEEEEFGGDEDGFNHVIQNNYDLVEQANANVNAASEISAGVLKMFVFVDIKNHRLFDLRQFTNVLKTYPKDSNLKQNHSISTWRQGLAALWKHFIIPQLTLGVEKTISLGFGNSKETFVGLYGVDTRFNGASELTYTEMSTATKLFHLAIGAVEKEDIKTTPTCETQDPPMDNYDLLVAGKQYFHDNCFDFKTKEQERFTTMVLQGSRKIVGLQAVTAFGKSLTFILPMMVIKKCLKEHHINFVCVPYQSLKMATIKKLEKGGLNVQDITLFSRSDVTSILSSVDVFVGCMESFEDGKLEHIFKNWDTIHGGNGKLGYLVFDEAHTLFLESKFRESLAKIRDLSWGKWRKTLFVSATMGNYLFNRILVDRNIPDILRENSLYINCVTEMPRPPVESEVEYLKTDEIMVMAAGLIMNFLDRSHKTKAVFFFTDKKKLDKVYSQVRHRKEVVKVNADSNDIEKKKTFAAFEDINSDKRVVMGTKLLSNGLDCKSVQFICLVDCYLNCVDYLQMVGRIREWGLVKVLINASRKPYPRNTEIGRLFPEIDWKRCISQQVAEFYAVPYGGHHGCCGVEKEDTRIQKLKSSLRGEDIEEDRTIQHHDVDIIPCDEEINDTDGLSDESLFDELCSDNFEKQDRRGTEVEFNEEGTIDNICTVENPITKAVKDILTEDDGTLARYWKDVLKLDFNVKPLRELTLNVNPKYIVIWDGTVSPSLCEECLMPLHEEKNCGALMRTVGKFVYEYLATYRILKSKSDFERIKYDVINKGANLFLLNLLRLKRNEATRLAVKLNEIVSRQPKFVGTVSPLPFDPVQTFIKYFHLIVTRKVNVVLLLLNNTIEYSPRGYNDLGVFYNVMFTDAGSIKNAIQYDETKSIQIIDKYIQNDKYLPVVITMIWIIYENKKYKRILRDNILVDHFEFADCFPVFFKYVVSIVNYNHNKVPLFTVIIGIILNDIAALHREEEYLRKSTNNK